MFGNKDTIYQSRELSCESEIGPYWPFREVSQETSLRRVLCRSALWDSFGPSLLSIMTKPKSNSNFVIYRFSQG